MMKKIFIDPNNINEALVKEAANTISQGRIVALPTETVYGLAVSSEIKEAVDRLYKLKQRSHDKPFTFVVDDTEKVKKEYFAPLSPFGHRLIESFWPGPITIIYYSQADQDKTIGVRVPFHIVTRRILAEAKNAVYLPSANISGDKEAVSAAEVEKAFGDRVDLIVDGGDCLYSQSSTVVDLTYHPFKILRPGAVADRDIINIFSRKRLLFVCTGNTCRSPMAQFLLLKSLDEVSPYFRSRYEVLSRGIAGLPGASMSPPVVSLLKEKDNIDDEYLIGFSANKLDRNMVLASDLIFTMEEAQRKHILNLESSAEGRVFNLGKFLPGEEEKDIPDPIGKDLEGYTQTYQLIKQAVTELMDWL